MCKTYLLHKVVDVEAYPEMDAYYIRDILGYNHSMWLKSDVFKKNFIPITGTLDDIYESISFDALVTKKLSQWMYIIRNTEYDTSKCALKECIDSSIICNHKLTCEECQVKWVRIAVEQELERSRI